MLKNVEFGLSLSILLCLLTLFVLLFVGAYRERR